jgi:O-antigen/teichoic acid export membrane protein
VPVRSEATQITRNAASSYAIRVLLVVTSLALTPYLFRRLGADGFGTWSVMFAVGTVFTLLQIGCAGGVSKYLAEYRAQHRRADLERTLSAALALLAVGGVLCLAISAAVGFLGEGLAAHGERSAFRWGILLIGAVMLVRLPLTAYAALLLGYQRYDLSNACWAFSILAFPVGAVLAVEAGAGVLGVAAAYAAGLLGGALLFAAMARRADPELPLRPGRPTRQALGSVGAFSSFTLLAESMVFISQRLDAVLIAGIRNAATAAPYAAAGKLQSGVQGLTQPFVDLLMPMTSDLWSADRRAEVARRLLIVTRVALQIALPVTVALALFADDVVRLWLGADAPSTAAGIVAALMAVQALTIVGVPSEKVLVGIGRARLVGTLAVVEGVSNLAVSVVLISSVGAIGAALGTLATTAAIAPVRLPLACRAIGCRLRRPVLESLLPSALAAAPGIAAMCAIRLALPPGTERLVAGLGAGMAICLAVAAVQVGPHRIALTARRLVPEGGRA